MRTATALQEPAPFAAPQLALPAQLPLPLPGSSTSIVPVPRTRDDDERARQLRAPVTRFMQGLAEVLTGGRPARQLSAWMTPDTHAALVRRVARELRGPRKPGGARMASVHLSVAGPHALEIAGRMVHGERSRAVAVRLELVRTPRGRQVWTCTALEWA